MYIIYLFILLHYVYLSPMKIRRLSIPILSLPILIVKNIKREIKSSPLSHVIRTNLKLSSSTIYIIMHDLTRLFRIYNVSLKRWNC